MASHKEVSDVVHMMANVAADTYKVSLLREALPKHSVTDLWQLVQLLQAIDYDTYRKDACKLLMEQGAAPDSLIQGSQLLRADTYKADFIKLWKRYNCKARSANSSSNKPTQKHQVSSSSAKAGVGVSQPSASDS